MTTTELNQFRAVLMARVRELEPFTRHREGITVERSADQLEEIQVASQRALAVCNLDREFNQVQNPVRPSVCIQEGSFGICQESRRLTIRRYYVQRCLRRQKEKQNAEAHITGSH